MHNNALLILLFYVFQFAPSGGVSIKLGILFPLTPNFTGTPFGIEWANIAVKAAEAINNQSYIPGCDLQPVVLDTKDTQIGTVNAALQCGFVDKCVGVVGAAVSDFSGLAQYVLQNFSIPQISPISTATELSNKAQFPTFLRTIPSDAAAGVAIAQVMHHFGWNNFGLIVGSDQYSESLYESFVAAAEVLKIAPTVTSYIESINPEYVKPVTLLKEGRLLSSIVGAHSPLFFKMVSMKCGNLFLCASNIVFSSDTYVLPPSPTISLLFSLMPFVLLIVFVTAYVQIFGIFANRIESERILLQAKSLEILGKNFVWIGGDALLELNGTAYPYYTNELFRFTQWLCCPQTKVHKFPFKGIAKQKVF